MTPFAQAAPDLIALGYSPIPLIAPTASHHQGRGKAPGECRGGHWSGMSKWQRFRDTAPSSFELGLWTAYPEANIGLVMGTPAGKDLHVMSLDFDAADGDVLDALLRAAPASPMVKRGQKGATRFYLAAKTMKTRSYDGPGGRLIDLLAGFDTRQTVCPPSIHPATQQPYVWLQGPVRADELPVFGEDDLAALEEALEQCGWARGGRGPGQREAKPAPADSDDIWSETKAAALANLSAWVPALDLYGCRPARGGYEAVASWRASSTGRALSERKLNLSINPSGIKDWGTNDTYSAIDLVMAVRDCDQAAATDWLRERLGLKDDGVVIALGGGGAEEITLKPTPPLTEAVAAPVKEISPPTTDLPDHLTRVPGLVGELTSWISDSARKPQRAGALLAALELVGTAAGRKYATPTLSGTHLYGLFLAPSGAAKDHPLKCIGRVLHACTMGAHFGPSGFMSMSALINRITRQPLTLTCIDEFGSFLGRINGRKASTHEKAITGVLRTAWGSSFDTMAPPEWAGRVGEPIHSPALSIYGVSTHEEFFQNLEGGDVFNGFLNRFLIFSTQQRVQEREPLADKMVVPAEVIDEMLAIYTSGNPLTRATSHNAMADAPMMIVPWADQWAHRAYQALAEKVERMDSDAVFYTRTAEMAQRLAVIRAIGVDPVSPRVTLADMDWGAEVALWSAGRMVQDSTDFMHESEHDQHMTTVRSVVRKAGTISRSDLVKRVHRLMDSRRLEGVIKMLVDGDMIHETRGPPPVSGGRGKTLYVSGPAPV